MYRDKAKRRERLTQNKTMFYCTHHVNSRFCSNVNSRFCSIGGKVQTNTECVCSFLRKDHAYEDLWQG